MREVPGRSCQPRPGAAVGPALVWAGLERCHCRAPQCTLDCTAPPVYHTLGKLQPPPSFPLRHWAGAGLGSRGQDFSFQYIQQGCQCIPADKFLPCSGDTCSSSLQCCSPRPTVRYNPALPATTESCRTPRQAGESLSAAVKLVPGPIPSNCSAFYCTDRKRQ